MAFQLGSYTSVPLALNHYKKEVAAHGDISHVETSYYNTFEPPTTKVTGF